MDEESTPAPALDWVNLPAGVEPQSLWACLHDGDLVRVRSDALARTAELCFTVAHIVEHHALSLDLIFVFRFTGVSELRALRWEPWPGPEASNAGLSVGEQSARAAEYSSKSRTVSLSWKEFEEVISQRRLEVYEANFVRGEAQVSMRFHGPSSRDDFHDVAVRGESLSVERSDGEPCSLEALVALGEAYWDAFEARDAT